MKVTDSQGRAVAEGPTSESLPVLAGGELSQPLLIAARLEPGKYTVGYRVNFQDGGGETEGVTELVVTNGSPKAVAQR